MNEDIVVRVENVEESITMYAREVGNRHTWRPEGKGLA